MCSGLVGREDILDSAYCGLLELDDARSESMDCKFLFSGSRERFKEQIVFVDEESGVDKPSEGLSG